MNGKKPTDLLKEEHKEVLQKLDALKSAINDLSKRDAVSAKLRELGGFFATDFWIHFTKEEDALFPEMEKFIPRDAGPIGVMLIEHDDLRKTNDRLQHALGQYFAGSSIPDTLISIQRDGNDFITVLRDHIFKEDNILFGIADMHLDTSQNAAILARFEQIAAGRG